MTALRAGILAGVGVARAGGGPPGLDAELERLGARVCAMPDELSAEEPGRWADAQHELTAVVFDAASAFAPGGAPGLLAVLDRAWAAVQEVSARLIASERPAKVLLIAPGPGAGPHAGAARGALENLARTLSVEWARYTIAAVALLPGTGTTAAQIRELLAFLLSPAGDYFSGCALELGAVSPPSGDQAPSSAQGTTTASS